MLQSSFLFLLFILPSLALLIPTRSGSDPDPRCQPIKTTFDKPSSLSHINDPDPFTSPFICLGSRDSCKLSPEGGLELHLLPPEGPVTRKGNLNDVVSDGATVNSTFSFNYGKVIFEIQAATVPGTVTAPILYDAISMNSGDTIQGDELDWELLGAHPKTCQTNMFSPKPQDSSPHYGMFNGKHRLPSGSGSIANVHSYSIARDADKIVWSVDGVDVRVQRREDSEVDGVLLWPRHEMKISLGAWDASYAVGTSNWAGGPIIWEDVKEPIKAVVKSVSLECW
ncbi:hypothetical protein VNI00_000591 [Paramarasmius palmivorus]|uniref:GH16 domain-containing protein n=1 Tax=Paramarasmius palmivorus TaxID=297713 RepID=A0AAW0E6G9_9AGAR